MTVAALPDISAPADPEAAAQLRPLEELKPRFIFEQHSQGVLGQAKRE